MPSLPETLTSDAKKIQVVEDCCIVIDDEVKDKGGLSGFAIKAGYAAVKGIKPGFVKHVVADLLPEFAAALDPIFQEAKTKGAPVASHFSSNASRVADALLAITDGKAKRSSSGVVKGTYEKLRSTAKKNVEAAVPRLGKLVEKHTN
jgi:phage-related tail fiber protein